MVPTTSSTDDPVVMLPPPGGVRGALRPIAQAIQADDQRWLGQRRTAALCRWFNRSAGPFVDFRRRLYEKHLDDLLESGGGLSKEPIVMRDGFAIDDSLALPHLDAVLAAGEEIIDQRAGRQWQFAKPYLQDISPKRAMDDHPALLDFICSPDVIAAVAPTFGFIPTLPGILPEGVRLMESSTRFDRAADGPWRGSQMFHRDYHSTPTVYVIIAVRDTAPEDGPLHFVGRAASSRVAEALDLGARGAPYRLTDEAVRELVTDDEIHVFAARAGTVLFIESSACLHFGSRRPAKPRYQMQYAFTSPVRNDFLELWRPQRVFPVRTDDQPLRRLVLDPTLTEFELG